MEPGRWLNTAHLGRSYYLVTSTELDWSCHHCGRLTAPGRLRLELGAVWYGAKGGHPIFARVPGDALLLSPGGQRGPGMCTRAMRVAVNALWANVHLPLALEMDCGRWCTYLCCSMRA